MSRIGKKPIIIDGDVTVSLEKDIIRVKGVKGGLDVKIPEKLKIKLKEGQIMIKQKNSKDTSLQGLYRTLIYNAVVGVKSGWSKALKLVGVGYRAQVSGNKLVLNLGFAHPKYIEAPEGIDFQVQKDKIIVSGIDKYLVGEIAATIRRMRPPEPYKGKGIRYENEHIRRKPGKAAKVIGGAVGK